MRDSKFIVSLSPTIDLIALYCFRETRFFVWKTENFDELQL